MMHLLPLVSCLPPAWFILIHAIPMLAGKFGDLLGCARLLFAQLWQTLTVLGAVNMAATDMSNIARQISTVTSGTSFQGLGGLATGFSIGLAIDVRPGRSG